jgi:AbrB family looped-hinge helix DNA binding protein
MKARKLATLSSKGQTTIPQEVRNELELVPGDQISFEISDGKVILRKAILQDDPDYLKSIEMTLAPEWMSDDDDDL